MRPAICVSLATLTVCAGLINGFAVTTARADVFSNVPTINPTELDGYQLAYDLNMPTNGSLNAATVPYGAGDHHTEIVTPWDRVAYYMELTNSSTGVTTWAYASMDPFGAGLKKLGLPNTVTGQPNVVFQTNVNNLHVFSSSNTSVINGSSFAASAGNIEFWPNNYGNANSAGISGASATTLDFGDQVSTTTGGYGSFQIHNHATGDSTTPAQTVIAYNHWGNAGSTNHDVGIGNDPNTARSQYNPDWTFAANANQYSVKRLQVLVHTNGSFTDPTTITPKANGYTLVYGATLPTTGAFQGTVAGGAGGTTNRGLPYMVDRTEVITGGIARVGYFVELHKKTDPAGQNQYVWVSMDAFTQNLKQIAIPTTETAAQLQQNVTNMSVVSNVGTLTGEYAQGNIELWSNSYSAARSAAAPGNASASTYDFGDTITTGGSIVNGYGSFQIHDFTNSRTILAYNNWGASGGDTDLGIGNATSGANPDWTFLHNALNDYDVRNFQVYVLVPEPTSIALPFLGAAAILRRRRRAI